MKRFNMIDKSLIIILTVLAIVMYFAHKAENTVVDVSEMVYYKPTGGENNNFEKVKLSCFIGNGKGADKGQTWCQEIVLEELGD